MPRNIDRFVVITGGPGAGKSTLLRHLRGKGFATRPEAGRAIIREQVGLSGPALPWLDPGLFAELMLSWDLRNHREAPEHGTVLFDRGVVDVVCYLETLSRPVPGHMRRAAETVRYGRRVFAAPPWPEIYERDAEREQSLDEAERVYEACVAGYAAHGYELVTLPRAGVEERARFVVATLSDRSG
ncbi:AAA family ATPase [Nonomuraea sp. LPB2021202275-12-8]|uniref:AAA family ATPase n=1 Tax=Nonomuraea sp. LPB2021202275-12-8 TaxID=3120159 RepID=UPI00300CD5AF